MEKWRNNQQETHLIFRFLLRFLQKPKLFLFKRNNEIMKHNNQCGSSETIRKAPKFDFDNFYKYGHAKHVPRIPETFLEWFIGFFEGDGYLGFSKNTFCTRVSHGKIYKQRVCERLTFQISQKEKRIIEKIADTFGFGTVHCYRQKETIYWRWTVDSKKSIENLAFLLSGNLILETRQKKFFQWVEKGKKTGMFKQLFTQKVSWSSNVDLKNAWLSGFIDAEGCFYAHFSLPPTIKQKVSQLPKMKKNWLNEHAQIFTELSHLQFRLSQKMTLTQRSTKQTNKVFKQIRFLFKGKSFYRFQNAQGDKLSPKEYVRIEFHSFISQELIVHYLTQYPLQTIKNVSFIRWKKVFFRRKEGVHLSPKGTKRLYRLVNAINHHPHSVYDKK
jgi:hypothetical protein